MYLSKSGSRFGAGFYLMGLLFTLLMTLCWSTPVADPNPQMPSQALPEVTQVPALERVPRDGNGTLELLFAKNGLSLHNGTAEAQYRAAVAANNAQNQNFTGKSHVLESVGVMAGVGAAGYGVSKGYKALMRWKSTSTTMDKWLAAQDVSWMDAEGVELTPDEVKKAMSSISNYNKIRNAKMADLQTKINAARDAGDLDQVARYENSMNMMQKDKFLTEKMQKLLDTRFDTLKELKDTKDGDARTKLEGELDDTESELQKYGWEGDSKNGLTRAEQRAQAGPKDSPEKIAADNKAKQFKRNGKNEMKQADYSDEDFRNDMASASEDMEKKIDLIENGSKGGKIAKFKQGIKNKFTTQKQLSDLKTEQANMEGRLKNLDEAAGKTYVPAANRVSAANAEDKLQGVKDSIDSKLDSIAEMKDYGWFRRQVRKLNVFRSTVESNEKDIENLKKQQADLEDNLSKINSQNAAGEKGQLQNQLDDLNSQIDAKTKQVDSIEADMAQTENSSGFKKFAAKLNPMKNSQSDLDKLNAELDQLNSKKAPIQRQIDNAPDQPASAADDAPKPAAAEGVAGDAAPKPSYSGADRLTEAKAQATYDRAGSEVNLIEAENADPAKYHIKDWKSWRSTANTKYKSLLEERSQAFDELKTIRQKMGKPPPEETPLDKKPAEKPSGDEAPAEKKPGDEVPEEENPAEVKPAEEKPVQAAPAEEKPGDKPIVDQAGEVKPPQGQAPAQGEGVPAEQQQQVPKKEPAGPPVDQSAEGLDQPASQMKPETDANVAGDTSANAPAAKNAAGDTTKVKTKVKAKVKPKVKAPVEASANAGDAELDQALGINPNAPRNAAGNAITGDSNSIGQSSIFKDVSAATEANALQGLENSIGINKDAISKAANALQADTAADTKAANAADSAAGEGGKAADAFGDEGFGLGSLFDDIHL